MPFRCEDGGAQLHDFHNLDIRRVRVGRFLHVLGSSPAQAAESSACRRELSILWLVGLSVLFSDAVFQRRRFSGCALDR